MDLTLPPVQAALINLGSNPLIGLVVLIIVVGIVCWLALWILDNFLSSIMSPPFAKAARMLIIGIGILVVVTEALSVIFGITLF